MPVTRTSPHRPICRDNGLTGGTRGIRPRLSCSTWIPWQSGRHRLEWALRLHPLPSAVCVQPIRRSGSSAIRNAAEDDRYTIGLKADAILRQSIAYLPTRPVGRPPDHMVRTHAGFSHRAGSWDKKRRVVARVERHPGERVPRVGFIVTRLGRPAGRVVASCNRRGRAAHRGRQEHDCADPAVMPEVPEQCRAAPASCARLQSR